MADGEPLPIGIHEGGNKVLLPYGDRVIGQINPKSLSEADFNNSPDILFHAANKPFIFSQDIDYAKFTGDYSSTAGSGLYTTNDVTAAQKYLKDRKKSQGGENATMMKFLPYQARMYDMRAQNNEAINAPVPKEMFQKYRQFVINYFKNKFPEGPPDKSQYGKPEWLLYENLREHKAFLNKLNFEKGEGNYEPVDLRIMLGIDGTMSSSEKGAITFTEFMLYQGYDGLIYYEGGDGWYESAPSFVFYNPKKVGTFQTWQK